MRQLTDQSRVSPSALCIACNLEHVENVGRGMVLDENASDAVTVVIAPLAIVARHIVCIIREGGYGRTCPS